MDGTEADAAVLGEEFHVQGLGETDDGVLRRAVRSLPGDAPEREGGTDLHDRADGHDEGAPTSGPDVGGGAFQAGVAAGEQSDGVSALPVRAGECAADPAAGAGYDDGLGHATTSEYTMAATRPNTACAISRPTGVIAP